VRVLITGGAGYIGSTLARELLDLGVRVRVLDSLRGGGDSLLGMMGNSNFEFIKGDVRDPSIVNRSLKGVSVVVHLAALVGHPLCNAFPDEAKAVNYHATADLFDTVIRNEVPRFIFASTCSNYGMLQGEDATEDSPLNPTNIYARAKVRAENYIMEKRVENTCTTILRFATAFGISPKTRMDLLLHEFVRDAIHNREILLYHKDSWRPYIHVIDVAQAVIKCITSPTERINGEIINVGSNHNNITKIDLANLVAKHVYGTRIKVVETGEDRRDYKVSFNKQRLKLRYIPTRSLEDGIIEIRDAIMNGVINPFDPRFYNSLPEEYKK